MSDVRDFASAQAQALNDMPDHVESASAASLRKRKSKPPTLSKNGVRMGRPPGTKNKPNPNGPKVGRPSLSTIFMRQQISVTGSSTAADSADGVRQSGIVCSSTDAVVSRDQPSKDPGAINVAITDEMRDRLGLLPFDPDLKFKHGYLAKRQKCRFAVIPIYSKEERLLFTEIIKDRPILRLDWDEIAKLWNPFADGKIIFYKLPEHLDSYFRLLRESALMFAANYPPESVNVDSLASFGKQLALGDMASMILALAVTAAYMSGSGVTMESLVTARSAVTIASLEGMVASLDAELQRHVDAQDSLLDPVSGCKKRGRKPGTKNIKPRKVESLPEECDRPDVLGHKSYLVGFEGSDEGDMEIDGGLCDDRQNPEQLHGAPSDVYLSHALSGSFEPVTSYYSAISSSGDPDSALAASSTGSSSSSSLRQSSATGANVASVSAASQSLSPFSSTLATMAGEEYAHDSRSLFAAVSAATSMNTADEVNNRGQSQQHFPIYYY
ncbi:hypothetical protein V1517DRAFT_324401 [Lipomyces orientalis]|uniref:Uncharacterized protein n=1 Tax=Lipomyces orientalis TaxID=1233043 RepID=A0ACC3TLV6_9ASCO